MDLLFKCPNCEQELEVDGSAAGSEINCPSCGEAILIPEPQSALPKPPAGAAPAPAHLEPHPVNPMDSSAARKVEMHLKVPVHEKPAEALISKPLTPLEVTAKATDKKIHAKTIRRIDCVEVGHDRFDEVVTGFLSKLGEENVISITTLNYTYLDIGTQKLLTDFGILIVYRG